MRPITRALASTLLVATASPALAQLQVFTDRASWLAALGSAVPATEDFNAVPATTVLTTDVPFLAGQVSITLVRGNTGGSGRFRPGDYFSAPDDTTFFEGTTGIAPGARFVFTLPTPATAFAAEYFSPGSGAGLILVVDGEVVDLTPIGTANGFRGVIAPHPFTSVEYRRNPAGTVASEVFSVDNVSWATTLTTPRCPVDFNASGAVDVIDIFAFLSAWFAQAPAANFNADAAVDVLDIFAFLSAWFAGCP